MRLARGQAFGPEALISSSSLVHWFLFPSESCAFTGIPLSLNVFSTWRHCQCDSIVLIIPQNSCRQAALLSETPQQWWTRESLGQLSLCCGCSMGAWQHKAYDLQAEKFGTFFSILQQYSLESVWVFFFLGTECWHRQCTLDFWKWTVQARTYSS